LWRLGNKQLRITNCELEASGGFSARNEHLQRYSS
jgi:hypothetical protein